MNSDPNFDLETFVQHFFTSRGADIEKHGSRLDVLAPQQLAERIGIPAFSSLSIGSQAPEGYASQYGSPILEKIAEIAGETVPTAIVRLAFHYLKSQGFDRLVQEQFSFHNGIVKVENSAAVQTAYLLLTCRYLAQSDEQKEGLLHLGFNLETGAPVDHIENMLDSAEKHYVSNGTDTGFDATKIEEIMQWVQRRSRILIEEQIAPFRASMNRRHQRDVVILEEYYAELQQEMTAALKREGLSAESIQNREEKIALIPDETAKKKEDLFKKYSIRVKLQLSGVMMVRTPAVKLFCKATIGRKQKHFTLFYNPITKSIDPCVCGRCGQATYHLKFSDQLNLHCLQC